MRLYPTPHVGDLISGAWTAEDLCFSDAEWRHTDSDDVPCNDFREPRSQSSSRLIKDKIFQLLFWLCQERALKESVIIMVHALYYPLLVVGATSMSILLGKYLQIRLE